MKVSARVQALDDEILAAAKELGTTDRRKIAAHTGRSLARVQHAFARAEGKDPRAGTGKPKKPLLEVALTVTLETWKASQKTARVKVPSAIRRALGPLRGRHGWQEDLAAAVHRALQPAPVVLPPADGDGEVDTLERLNALLAAADVELKRAGLSASERIRCIEASAKLAERIERLRPAAEARKMIDPAQIPEAAHSGQAKLRHVLARRRRERERLVQHLLEQATERGPAHYQATVWTLRELGELPREGDGDGARATEENRSGY